MNTHSTRFLRSRRLGAVAAFSLVEILASVATVATMATVGVTVVSKARQASAETALERDVRVLNEAVAQYLGNGGSLAEAKDAAAVVAKLKTTVSAADAKRLVGQAGPFVDTRLALRTTKAAAGEPRAVWDAAVARFVIRTRGAGVSEFYTDASLSGQKPVTEKRETAQQFAKDDAWVWDPGVSADAVTGAAPSDSDTEPTVAVRYPAQAPATPTLLQPPTLSRPAGLYDYTDYPLPIVLTNPNPPGSSRLVYRIDDGPWTSYTDGATISVPKDKLDSTVTAFALPVDGELFTESEFASALYQTIFFKGVTDGDFSKPKGDPGLVTNLTSNKKGSYFSWGTPSEKKEDPNWLQFSPAGGFAVLPEQEFKIGEIKYYNGTTFAGTNATSVELDVLLNMEVPKLVEKLEFTLKLLSTPNYGWNKDQDADFVWIPTLSSKFSTTVQGQTFYLQLRFGSSTGNGFTTIDEFHVREDKTATGAIYGKLTTKPQF